LRRSGAPGRQAQVAGEAAGVACDAPVEPLEDSAAGLAALDSEAPEDEGVVEVSDDPDAGPDEDVSFDDEPVRASFL
jgi:hypothetical protein